MKLILSRKGFDSASGGVASPIMPDGALLSLPIPSPHSDIAYNQLQCGGTSLDKLIQDLRGSLPDGGAHLDPDLRAEMCERKPGWRPLFGQAGAARSHLVKWGVEEGDLFLFFGWFRRVEWHHGHLGYVNDAPDQHVIFGWLQIETILPVGDRTQDPPPWSKYHPHFHDKGRTAKKNNTIYISRAWLKLPGVRVGLPGAGAFAKYRTDLCLTGPECTRSVWHLPRWFYPNEGRRPLSYHSNMDRWSLNDDCSILHSVGRGQEFVLDTKCYPEAAGWIESLMAHAR